MYIFSILRLIVFIVLVNILFAHGKAYSQCPTIINSTFNASCLGPGSPCNMCAYQTITLGATGVNLPNGGCIKWYYSQTSGFNPYNGEGTLINCGSINSNIVADVTFATTEAMCGNGTYYVVGVVDPLNLSICPEVFTNEFSFLVNCPSATIDTMGGTCFGQPIHLLSSGGVSYQWAGPASFSSNLQNPFTPNLSSGSTGTYYVTVTGANGCKSVKSIDIIAYPGVLVTMDPPFIDEWEICQGDTLTLSVTSIFSGSGFYKIKGWYYPINTLLTNNTTVDAFLSGWYYFRLVDSLSRCKFTYGHPVNVIPSININIFPDPLQVCNGGYVTATAVPTNGQSPYLYNWSTGETTNNITISLPGTYDVTVTDSKGCTGTKSVTVTSGSPIVVNISDHFHILGSRVNMRIVFLV